MTRLHATGIVLCTVCMVAGGCASVTDRVDPSPQSDKVAIFESAPPGSRSYRLVQRVWTGSPRSKFTVPRYGSAEAGASDLRNQAIALGGDAIMNFGCYRADPSVAPDLGRGLICNGNVIKYGP